MIQPSESYLKVHYELRPAKQVERRMLIEAFQLLSAAGFPISTYQYTGMGSIYFIDFILVHRLLGITSLLSVEYSTKVRRRVEFNKPFDCVDIRICPISDVIPELHRDQKHILWLDYDDVVRNGHLQDLSLASTYLTSESLLLITLDVEEPAEGGPKEWLEHFRAEGREHFNDTLRERDFRKSDLARRTTELVYGAIQSGLTGRIGIDFIPLFNFIYKDGHRMLTIGGMIGSENEAKAVKESDLSKKWYFRNDLRADPCVIEVPRLTRKERLYLDKHMPCKNDWTPSDFELDEETVRKYREIYRYCPTYAELLV